MKNRLMTPFTQSVRLSSVQFGSEGSLGSLGAEPPIQALLTRLPLRSHFARVSLSVRQPVRKRP